MRGSSPFSNYADFSGATGPIYTFADRPAIIGILTVLSALIFLYFIYATYTIKKGVSSAKSPVILSVLLATSVVSMADMVYTHLQKGGDRPTANISQNAGQQRSRSFEPLALLGLVGAGSFASRRRATRRTKRASQQQVHRRVRLRR